MGPGDLDKVLCDLPLLNDPNVIRGMESLDDAGVYKLTDDLAIIQTIDFFTPIVDDPYMFGQIAVANALSDVYTMGGKPLTAMNIVCFPIDSMDLSILKDILLGGIDKMREANVTLVGGHSINDPELKYGLSVTGAVHPDKMITNTGGAKGDKVILTKPLGTGIINTAAKAQMADENTIKTVTASMAALNKKASELAQNSGGLHACTDITGFGFLGHAVQLVKNSGITVEIDSSVVPLFPDATDLAAQGMCPAGLHRNREFYSPWVEISDSVPLNVQDVLYDPQTSGGLFIIAEAGITSELMDKLKLTGVNDAAVIGEVTGESSGKIMVV
ncbi:MAG: selenide, water dikinase SelD [Dehalococcoidales bacterium]|nr:MAG: selenide, water dikinase SelD [Dehalococcoidales bacterium]